MKQVAKLGMFCACVVLAMPGVALAQSTCTSNNQAITEVVVTNADILFLENIQDEARLYSSAELKKWNMGEGRAVVPECADANNLSHIRLLIAANPDRYEGYVMYGLYFFNKRKIDVAVVAYEKAIAIIRKNKIAETVAFSKFYDICLVRQFLDKNAENQSQALCIFEKLADYDFGFFDQEPKVASCISMAAMDYYAQENWAATMTLIKHAHTLKNLPPDVSTLLCGVHELMSQKTVGSG